MTATNEGSATSDPGGSAALAPPAVKGGIPEEIFDLGSGVQTVAAGADFTGEDLRFAVSGAGATIDPVTGVASIPTDRALQATVTVTATNPAGSASSSFRVTVEAEGVPFALEPGDVEIGLAAPAACHVRFPGLADEMVDAIEWTADEGPDARYAALARAGDGYRLDLPARAPLRFRWRRTAEGPWSGASQAFAAPAPEARWLPLVSRSREQFERGIVGGGGFQFFRSWGYSPAKPDRLFGVQDIDIPIRTEDFGGWWESAPSLGLKVGISGQGCAIDSEDGDRILVMYSAASRRFLPGWNAQAGIYLSEDGGDSFALAQRLDDLPGSAEHGSRFMQFPFVEVPGGTPATRTWYAFQRRMPKGGPVRDGALWRSTDGGRSWAVTGETLAVAKFGERLCVLRRAASGDFYLGTSNGLFRSADEGGSWTRLAGLPEGDVLEIDVKGRDGEVWACVGGAGLYRSTDHGASWTALTEDYDIQTFAISPHDRDRILIAGAAAPRRMEPLISTDGGASWSEIVSRPYPGQPERFQSRIQGSHAYFVFHATDPDLVFAARFQHFGRSTDGGRSFDWASDNFDYNYVHDIAVDPGDWTQMALAMQDRMLVFTENGCDWVWDDAVDQAVRDEVAAQAGYRGHTGGGRGALILRNGTDRRIISGAGNGFRAVTLVHAPDGDNPIGSVTVPDHRGEVAWCVVGANDTEDPSRGYIGRWRYELAADGTLTGPVDVGYEVIGAGSGAGVVFGVERAEGEGIWRSTDHGATWTRWATAPEPFRPIDREPVLVTDRSHPARALMVTASGRAWLIEGFDPTVRQVFDLEAQIGPGYPAYELYHCALDPRDPDVAYVTANVYGGPSVFRTLDLSSDPPAWSDISGNGPRDPRKIYVHPATGDVITSYHHGSVIFPARSGAGARAAFTAAAPSLYDRIAAFPGIRR